MFKGFRSNIPSIIFTTEKFLVLFFRGFFGRFPSSLIRSGKVLLIDFMRTFEVGLKFYFEIE